jgi:3-oxoacyl-[acyl-carrier-protein] synthase III
MKKLKTESAKISSTLMKDIRRIRKTAEAQTKMNTLRKYQIKMLNKFIEKLLKEGRITKQELKKYSIRKKEAEKRMKVSKNL